MSTEEALKIISNETLNSIHDISVVTPSIYRSIFSKHALAHDTDILDEDKITNKILDEKILMCQDIQEKTSKSALTLSDNTSRAILAIQTKDESKLNEVLKETQNLRDEIEKLKEAVYKDELTHAYNRKWMNDNYLNSDTETFNASGILSIIDLNYFKIINDTHGHVVGDKVLVFIANQLRKSKENVIRYGGDEFIILFSSQESKESALKKLNNIRESIISKKLKAGDKSFRVSFSFGAYTFKEGDSLPDTIELADKDMYEDKIEIKKRITGID
ncbi:GGDEF domain-containing protein [Sulfurimonas sp. SAG-AH-194-I05]|nr:GGDEF domain-containing protein [Sulfurimonas sp. SAG-AH-194-I05]MDF1875682.1 GGDEF domain-containing protein [Sulfurimonas sp. SAG-AH-194-I05]